MCGKALPFRIDDFETARLRLAAIFEAEPQNKKRDRFGKAKPFRTSGGGAAPSKGSPDRKNIGLR
jgi:hypothetical protein